VHKLKRKVSQLIDTRVISGHKALNFSVITEEKYGQMAAAGGFGLA
jgi:hypothetical protein